MHKEKIAVLDFSRGEVIISDISEREEASDFFARKGIRKDDVQWMRGDLKIIVENETKD